MGLKNLKWTKICIVYSIFLCAFLITEINGQCSSNQFKCGDKKCIPITWQCDDEADCDDKSDESNCEARSCTETEIVCNTGKCIPRRWQCDSENDCGDNSDEDPEICKQKTCQPTEFACRSPEANNCIPITWHCDGHEDCADGSDEKEDCHQITCSEDEFTCQNNKCITKRWLCDQENDCGDRSDEINCPNVTCSTNEFMCNTGKCIPQNWRCDGSFDCVDESDEKNCPTNNPSSICSPREFLCHNKKDCIHITWQCDGDLDCPDRSDEVNCTNTCRPDQFQCRNLQCIPAQLQCNGLAECPDESDEADCDKLHPAKCDPRNQFDCGKNHCISLSLVCDGVNDCGNYEDEPKDKCGINECSVENGGCSQICRDLHIGYECSCNDGFKLTDNKTCDDVNECEIPGSCSQLCYNTKGGYKCECLQGYTLEPSNHRRCRASEGHPALIFANRQDIRKIDLETLEYVSLVSDLRNAVAVDYDFRTGTIFWSDIVEEAIKSAPLDTGSPITAIISEKIITADGIAVDWIYDHIYWTDTGKNSIEMADKSGKMRKTLITSDLDEPRAIVLNPHDGWMYWTDWGEPAKIERAGMDGSHRSVIISTDIKWPNGLAIDFVSQKIFWADAKLHILSSADYNGDNRRVVLSSPIILKHPFSIDIFEDWIYWTDWESGAIHQVNKFTGAQKKDIKNGIFSPMDIHVYHHYKQPEGKNYCNDMNGRCSHLCLPSPNISSGSAKYTCACPDGMILNDDTTCVPETLLPITPISTSEDMIHEVSTFTKEPMPSYTVVQTKDPSSVNVNNSQTHRGFAKAWESGQLAGIIIGGLTGLLILVTVAVVLLYNHFKRKNVTSMNFDNPVYRKTTEDQFSLEKNQYQPARSYPPSLEPLTSPGTNEFV